MGFVLSLLWDGRQGLLKGSCLYFAHELISAHVSPLGSYGLLPVYRLGWWVCGAQQSPALPPGAKLGGKPLILPCSEWGLWTWSERLHSGPHILHC